MITLLEVVFVTLIVGSVIFYLVCAICTNDFFTSTQGQIKQNLNLAIDTSYTEAKQGKNRLDYSLALPRNTSVCTVPDLDDTKFVPVSILLSVKGIDEGAWENWLSLCTQDYPKYEVLFGVTDDDDPVVPLLKKLAAQFPKQVRLFVGLEPRGVNYKDSNLSYLLEASQHEVIIFADGDIRVNPNYIHTVTAPLRDPQVGIVTCAYIGHHPQYLSAAVASFGRCIDFIPSLLIALKLYHGLQFAIGVTMATRKSALANFGGLHLNRIGSDYNLGKRAAMAGYQVQLSPEILEWDTGRESLQEIFTRELRWARTIRYNRGAQYYTLAFCHGTVYCIPLLLLSGFADWAIAVTCITYLIRYAQALVSIFSMNSPKLLHWLWVIPLRDLLSWFVWFMGAFGQRIYWRGRYLRVEADGIISPLNIS
jgi:ceramide glucosyltransferase